MARKPEPKTVAVRQLIDEHGPNLTWNPTEDGQPSAKVLLKALGFTDNAKTTSKHITENDFNVKKHLYLNAQNERKGTTRVATPKSNGRVSMPKDDVFSSISAINKSGGLDSYRAALDNETQKLERMRERCAEMENKVVEMQANIDTYEQVQKAVA